MKVELKVDKNFSEPKIIVYANEITNEITELVNNLQECSTVKNIIGYIEDKAFILDKDKIESFFTEDSKVYARRLNEKYRIKKKIYELEEMLKGTSFVRISNCEIANFNEVESLDIKGSSLICLKYKSGEITYVSRRNISKIKKYLNI